MKILELAVPEESFEAWPKEPRKNRRLRCIFNFSCFLQSNSYFF